MDDIHLRDLSQKPHDELTDEEKQELARRFQEFQDLVREKGAQSLDLRQRPRKKRVTKWTPTATGAAKPQQG